MLRIAICDDSADVRDALRLRLEKILWEGTEEIVYEFSTGAGACSCLCTRAPKGNMSAEADGRAVSSESSGSADLTMRLRNVMMVVEKSGVNTQRG